MSDFNEAFFVSLLSNVSSDHIYNYNTIGNFTTKLQKKISLSDEWEVALFKISYTRSWYNIRESFEIKIIDSSGTVHAAGFLGEGTYSDENSLINAVNNQMTRLSKLDDKEVFSPPKLHKNPASNVAVIKPGQYESKSLYPLFGRKLLDILGMSRAFEDFFAFGSKDGKKIKGYKPIDVGQLTSPIFVYCDIVYPSLVGDKCVKLLSIVENKAASFGDQVFCEFQNLQYHKLSITEFDTIEVDIKDEFDTTLPFQFGRTIVTLHFRKRHVLHNLLQ